MNIKKFTQFHLIAAGGIGMEGLRLFLDSNKINYTISDDNANLANSIKESDTNIEADCVVISTAITKNHPQYAYAIENDIPIIHRSTCTRHFMNGEIISVCGSHGKTTSSGLISWILKDRSISFLLGGHLNGKSAQCSEDPEYFVVEADESDGSMNMLSGKFNMITNISEEHIGYYGTVDNFVRAMNDYAESCDLLICNNSCKDLINRRKNVLYYGKENIKNLCLSVDGSKFDAVGEWGTWHIKTKLTGNHMAENIVGCISLLNKLGISEEEILSGIESFPGMQKRMELFNVSNDRHIIQDYAHHPKEVESVVSTIMEVYKNSPIHILWQPHKFSRLTYKNNFDLFLSALSRSEITNVLVLPVWSAGEEIDPNFTHDFIVQSFHNGVKVESYQSILEWCETNFNRGDVLLAMGAGDIYKQVLKVINRLK